MKNIDLVPNQNHKKIDYFKNFNDFAQKVCQNLPFSNILLLSTDSDFFDFGHQIYNSLHRFGAKVKRVVVKQDNLSQLDDFLSQENLFFDFRGIVIFNKQILCHLNSINKNNFPKIFYLQISSDIFGVFDNNVALVEHYFCLFDINKIDILKTFLIRTLNLIDYLFSKALTQQEIDNSFFNNVKRLIVGALISIKHKQDNLDNLFNSLIMLEKTMALNSDVKYFSANISCKLMQKSYYDLNINFLASKQIIKYYKNVTISMPIKNFSYSERARLVSYYSGKDIIVTLRDLNYQLKQIVGTINDSHIKEIKSLIKIFEELANQTEKERVQCQTPKDKIDLFLKNKLDDCISVCGDTSLSINGMTFVRQTSLSQ